MNNGLTAKIDHLRFALTLLENRTDLVDKKASIHIAIQIGIGAVVAGYINRVIDLFALPRPFGLMLFLLFIVSFLLAVLSILLFIQTIRPTKYIFGWRCRPNKLNYKLPYLWLVDDYWPTPEEYEDFVNKLDDTTVLNGLKEFHYCDLQLLKRKYIRYSWAVLLMKYMIITGSIPFLIYFVFKFIN